MALDPITAALDLAKMVIPRIWKDPAKQAEQIHKLEELARKGDSEELQATVKLLLAQVDVNKLEAQSGDRFVAGWRPFIGWVGGFSLAYAGMFHPLLTWLFHVAQALNYIPVEVSSPPYIETGILGTIVTGMLGIGGMRSFDKFKGTDTKHLISK